MASLPTRVLAIAATTTSSAASTDTGPFKLNLDPISMGFFVSSIIFGLFTLVQIAGCIFGLIRRSGSRGAYIALLFSLVFFFLYQLMLAIEIVKDFNLVVDPTTKRLREQQTVKRLLSDGFYVVLSWVWTQAGIFLIVALLLQLRSRGIANAKASQALSPPIFSLCKWLIDAVPLFFWQLLTFASLGVYAVYRTTDNLRLIQDLREIVNNMGYARLALRAFMTLDVWISAIIMSSQLKREKFADRSISFIALIIGPALILAVLSNIAFDIVVFLASPSDYNVDALDLFDTIFEYLLVFVAVSAFLVAPKYTQKSVQYD